VLYSNLGSESDFGVFPVLLQLPDQQEKAPADDGDDDDGDAGGGYDDEEQRKEWQTPAMIDALRALRIPQSLGRRCAEHVARTCETGEEFIE